tara:strand:+ start:1643 stop:1894 length:252 start_codon:yes stop_codon:yes gene_type:complete
MVYRDRIYVIFEVRDLDSVDFSQVIETSKTTVRKNVKKTHTFIKYEGVQPQSVARVPSKSVEYNYEDFLLILQDESWSGADII